MFTMANAAVELKYTHLLHTNTELAKAEQGTT